MSIHYFDLWATIQCPAVQNDDPSFTTNGQFWLHLSYIFCRSGRVLDAPGEFWDTVPPHHEGRLDDGGAKAES